MMALAVQYDLDVEQMDAITAFLQSDLKEETIFMEQPEGYEKDPTKVCKLKKALYGLKQSSRVWNRQLDEAMRQFGLTRSRMDPCLYFKVHKNEMIFVTIYVDDLLIITNNAYLKKRLKEFLNNRFQMKDLGTAQLCLGLRINRDRKGGTLRLDQQHYIEEVLKRFNLNNCRPVATPADPGNKLEASTSEETAEEIQEMQNVPYKEAVGCLTYLAQGTRPDILLAVNKVSQFSSNPTRRHWEAVKRIMRYLKGTIDYCLEYSREGDPQFTGYTDADWGGDPASRKSTTGYIFKMMGGAVSWNVKRQASVALSSCEAEFVALSHTTQEALWWKQLLQEIGSQRSISIFCDNQSAICIAQNEGFNPKTKHISIRFHFVKDTLERGDIKLYYIPTQQQPADGFTKVLPKQKHEVFRSYLGIVN